MFVFHVLAFLKKPSQIVYRMSLTLSFSAFSSQLDSGYAFVDRNTTKVVICLLRASYQEVIMLVCLVFGKVNIDCFIKIIFARLIQCKVSVFLLVIK